MFSLKSALAIALLAATAVWSDVSPDETCGEDNEYTCPEEIKCCSVNGFCGSTDEYCLTTAGCQDEFSNSTSACIEPVDGVSVSPDGTCGSDGAGEYGYRCSTEDGNSCCSISGYCGNSTSHCSIADGCQSAYGECK